MSANLPGALEPPRRPTGPTVIAEEQMRQLLAEHLAVALLENHFPVPARYGGLWFHSPRDDPSRDYIPASPAQCAQFERLYQRSRAAASTAAGGDPRP